MCGAMRLAAVHVVALSCAAFPPAPVVCSALPCATLCCCPVLSCDRKCCCPCARMCYDLCPPVLPAAAPSCAISAQMAIWVRAGLGGPVLQPLSCSHQLIKQLCLSSGGRLELGGIVWSWGVG